MTAYKEHSNRRMRFPKGGDPRRSIAVRWPFNPKGGAGSGGLPGTPRPWGSNLLCPRSMICETSISDPEQSTPATSYSNPPDDSEKYRRRVLSQKNSVRDVLFWRHAHVWNWWRNDMTGSFPTNFRIDRAYWDWVSDYANSGYPAIPLCNEFPDWPSPFPMSRTAKWVVPLDTGTRVGDAPNDKWIYDIRVFENPEPISGGKISWEHTDYSEHKASLNRSCTRYIYWKDCFFSGDTNSIFLPVDPYFIVREANPNILLVPEHPAYGREQNDLRFLPFGVTDCENQIPFLPGNLMADALKNPVFEMEEWPTGISPSDPPSPYEDFSAEGNFATDDVGYLNGDMIYSAMNYLASPLWLHDPVPGARSMIPNEQFFDLFMRVNFYKFKLYKWTDYDGSPSFTGELVEDGFGGAYGDCYAIF